MMSSVHIATNMGASSSENAVPPATLCCEHHVEKPVKSHHYHLELPSIKEIRQKPVGLHCAAIFYILFAAVCLIVSIADVILSSGNTALTKALDSEASGRLVGTVILAICAGICAVIVAYSIYAVCKKNCKALRVVSIILAVLVLVQILLLAFAVSVKKEDKHSLEASMTNSWLQATKEHDPASIKVWELMQSELKCCGLHSPEDYRDPENPFQPLKMPFPCCLSYQRNQSDFYVKWQLELCILNKSYYEEGCLRTATNTFKNATNVTIGVSILLIVLEAIIVAIGFYLSRKCTRNHRNDPVLQSESSLETEPKK